MEMTEWFLEIRKDLIRLYQEETQKRQEIVTLLQLRKDLPFLIKEDIIFLIEILEDNLNNILWFINKCNKLDDNSSLEIKDELIKQFKFIHALILVADGCLSIIDVELVFYSPFFKIQNALDKDAILEILRAKELVFLTASNNKKIFKKIKMKGD